MSSCGVAEATHGERQRIKSRFTQSNAVNGSSLYVATVETGTVARPIEPSNHKDQMKSAKQLRQSNPQLADSMLALLQPAKPSLYCVIVDSAVGESEFIPLTTLNEASAAFRAFCDNNGFGARDAGDCQIWHNGQLVAHVAFNGNVFRNTNGKRAGKDDLLFNHTGLVWTGNYWDITEALCA
jgi:hypothetical protein